MYRREGNKLHMCIVYKRVCLMLVPRLLFFLVFFIKNIYYNKIKRLIFLILIIGEKFNRRERERKKDWRKKNRIVVI